MTTEIPQRLREYATDWRERASSVKVVCEAATHIERLTSENEALREALKDNADTFDKLAASLAESDRELFATEIAVCELSASGSRAALSKKGDGE